MLKTGVYISEGDNKPYDWYRIKISVKETDKSYIFCLVERKGYIPAHIDMMFSKSDKVIVKKKGSQHVMRIWSDEDFTIYPYQAGLPYYFQLIDQ